jgi:predicted O-methyltransferase YrrM
MGNAFNSPVRRWEVLAGLAQSISAKTFVEVGCKEGRTTGFLLENLPELQVIAIDPWAPVANADEDYSNWDFDQIEKDFWANVGENRMRCHQYPATSIVIATGLLEMRQRSAYFGAAPPAPFDMVFIDAGHDYDNALADIKAWWPLVREGGILCGHDYQHNFPGVMRAVAKAFPLIRVAVCPDSVWVVQKDADVRLAA